MCSLNAVYPKCTLRKRVVTNAQHDYANMENKAKQKSKNCDVITERCFAFHALPSAFVSYICHGAWPNNLNRAINNNRRRGIRYEMRTSCQRTSSANLFNVNDFHLPGGLCTRYAVEERLRKNPSVSHWPASTDRTEAGFL